MDPNKTSAQPEPSAGSASPPPPTGSAAAPATPRGGRAEGVIISAVIAGFCFCFVLMPLLWFIPSFWWSAVVAGVVAVIVLGLIGRVRGNLSLIPIGLALFALPLLIISWRSLGDEPRNPKPAPWSGQAWEGTEVEYWDLSTGSRIGYVHFVPDQAADAAPIIFLHGGPGGGVVPTDGDFARRLNDGGLEVYLVDQAGVGWSDLLDVDEYTIDRMVADLDAIRIEIGADQLNLVGHSWGGSYAAHYMVSHDDRVERAWLSNPGDYGGNIPYRSAEEEPDLAAGDGGRSIPFSKPPPLRAAMAFALDTLGAQTGAIEDLASQDQMIRVAPTFVDIAATFQSNRCAANPYVDGELNYAPQTNFNFFVNSALNGEVGSHDETEGLDTIATPVIVARGMCDNIAWDTQRIYRDNIPGSELIVIPGEGHDMRPSTEMIEWFTTGDVSIDPWLSDDVPSPG